MPDEQLHTVGLTLPGIHKVITELQELIQSFQDPLSADDLLILARLYTRWQILRLLLRGVEPETLIALGRTRDALTIARFTGWGNKFRGLTRCYDALTARGEPVSGLLDEIVALSQQATFIEEQVYQRDWLSGALADAGRFDEALRMARSIPCVDHGMAGRASTLFRIATRLRKADRHTQADEVLTEGLARYSEVDSTWAIIDILMDRLSDAIESDLDDEIDTRLKDLQEKLNDPTFPDRFMFLTRLGKMLAKSKHNRLAVVFFYRAATAVEEIEASLSNLNQLIESLAASGYSSEAEVLLSEFSAQSAQIEARGRLFPLSDVYQAQARVLAAQGKLHEAHAAARQINPNWRGTVLNELAVRFADRGQRPEAELILQDIMKLARHDVAWGEHSRALTAMAVVWHQAGHARAADFLFQKSRLALRIHAQMGLYENELSYLIKALGQTGRFAQARELAGAVDSQLCDLALIGLQAGLDAETVLGQVAHLMERNDTTVLKDLARIYMAAGRMDEAERIFDRIIDLIFSEMRSSWWNLSSACRDVIASMDAAGFVEKSDRFLNEGLGIVREIPEPPRQAHALYNLAICLAQKGRLDEARSVIAEADAVAPWISSQRAEAQGEIALYLAQSGHHQAAQAAFQQCRDAVLSMPETGIQAREARADAVTSLARLLCEAGYIEQAREATFNIQYGHTNSPKVRFATLLARTGHWKEAFQIIGSLSGEFWGEGPDQFLQNIAGWSPGLDQLRPGLTRAILQDAVNIIGHVFPDWQDVHKFLAESQ